MRVVSEVPTKLAIDRLGRICCRWLPADQDALRTFSLKWSTACHIKPILLIQIVVLNVRMRYSIVRSSI